jgi:hypothetical protein
MKKKGRMERKTPKDPKLQKHRKLNTRRSVTTISREISEA